MAVLVALIQLHISHVSVLVHTVQKIPEFADYLWKSLELKFYWSFHYIAQPLKEMPIILLNTIVLKGFYSAFT